MNIVANLKPGSKPEHSGQFRRVTPEGRMYDKLEVTGIEGKPLPPTPIPGLTYRQVDVTRHKK